MTRRESQPFGPWCLYILECAGGRLYTGITVNLEARYKAHATGRGAKPAAGKRKMIAAAPLKQGRTA